LMRGRLGGIEAGSLSKAFGKAALASGLMGAALWLWLMQFGESPFWLQAGGGILLGGSVYGLTAWLLKVPELKDVLQAVQQRIAGRKLKEKE